MNLADIIRENIQESIQALKEAGHDKEYIEKYIKERLSIYKIETNTLIDILGKEK